MLDDPNGVCVFPVTSNQVIAGRQGFVAYREIKRDIHQCLPFLCEGNG
jgi:hypothetical protein